MKAIVIISSFGLLAFNEENKLIEKVLFPKEPRLAAGIIAKIEAGKVVEELSQLVERLRSSGYDALVFEDSNLAKQAQEVLKTEAEVSKPSVAGEVFRSEMEKFAVETGFVKDAQEFALWTHNLAMETAKQRVKGAVEKRDMLIAQAIQALDDVDRTSNLFMSHVREWYGIHFPELDRLLDKHETYARLVLELGMRSKLTIEKLVGLGIPETKARAITQVAEASMGADLAEADLAPIQSLCRIVAGLYQLRQEMEKHLDKAMAEVAPNTKALVGSLLGARLIAVAGGLTNLARRPASTVQVLGAEKALFRSLKSGARPPKHGLIFQHTLLHEAKRWQRGKIARALAGKLTIAIRADAFGGRVIGQQLEAGLERRIEEIRQKYAEPPPPPERKPRQERRERERARREKRWRRRNRGGKS